MLKYIWKDYKADFKGRLKYAYLHTHSWIYFFVYLPLICSWDIHSLGAAAAWLLWFEAVMLAEMYPNYMSKAMYLCPLSRQQRREYLIKGYLLKVGICMASFWILFVPLILLGKAEPLETLGVFVFYVSFVVMVNVHTKYEKNIPNKDAYMGYYSVWRLIGYVVNLMGIVLFYSVWDAQSSALCEYIGIGMGMITTVICSIIMVIRYLPRIIERNVDYENCDRGYFGIGDSYENHHSNARNYGNL